MAENDGKGWTDEELEASLAAYQYMQQREDAGRSYTKREIYRSLAERYGRLRIHRNGEVELDPEVAAHYPELQGLKCNVWN